MMVLFFIFGAVTLISLSLQIWQWRAGRAFPLHQPVASAETFPSVTLLKPLKGCDEHTADCLRSWLTQDFPAHGQVLFGVKDTDDPVCEIVRGLIAEFPNTDARLVICPEILGPNLKVSTLMQLEPLITGETIVISDADVKAPPNYLREALTILQRDGVGLVNSFYRLANSQNRAMWIEAIAVNCDFWSQVCQSNTLRPMQFALGAAMTLRTQTLKEIGGFKQLVDYLADDNRLGLLVHRAGQQIKLSSMVVDCFSGPMTFRQVWDHQLRWARTIRVCEPVPFFFSVLTNSLVWSLLWLVTAIPFGNAWPLYTTLGGMLVYAIVRTVTAWSNGNRLTNGQLPFWKIVQVLDVRDALAFLWWLFAFLGNTIAWRGHRHRILKEGRLEEINSTKAKN